MATVEIDTGTYVKRYDFWNPATWGIPKLYWDAFSQEQRIHAICRQLEKVIRYADYVGVNVDDIAARLKAIEDGQIDQIIIDAVNQWFIDHEPDIWQALVDAQADIDAIEAEIGTGFDAENTIANAISDLQNDVSDNTAKVEQLMSRWYSEPNFRCIDRFIYGDWGLNNIDSAQAGCVFKQDGLTYWVQTMNSSSNGEDRIIIRNLESNTEVARLTGQFGHGYTISYNPNTKQLLTQDKDSTPNTIIIIDVSDLADVQITEIISLAGVTLDNPCWYDDTHIIASTGSNVWSVFKLSDLTVTDTYTLDLHGYAYGTGYVFQNMCWYAETNEAFIGTTQPDGFIICDVDETNKKIVMKDFIACQQYYGYLYMREMEFAYRLDNKIYINQFDQIDGLMVVALLEWDMENGTIPNENSKYIQPSGNIGFTINYDTGALIQNSSADTIKYKLAGDAINEARAIDGYARIYLIFDSDYPHLVQARSAKVAIQNTKAVTIKGFHFNNCDILWNPSYAITVNPVNQISGTNYAGVYINNSHVLVICNLGKVVELDNPDSVANPFGWYMQNSSMQDLQYTNVYQITDWFRWCSIITAAATNLTDATVFNCSTAYRD